MPDVELRDEDVVWRFMDLWKFISMLEGSELYLTRIDKLEDPFDGQLHPHERDAAKKRILKNLVTKADREKFEKQADALLRQGCTDAHGPAFVSCWYVGKNSSYAMWKLYCPNGHGVAVQSTVGQLRALEFESLELSVDAVEYRYTKKLGAIDEWERLPFLKRVAYDFEREVRLVGRESLTDYLKRSKGTPSLKLEVDLPSFLTKVWAPAGGPTWQKSLLEALVKRFKLDIAVARSGILDDAWGTREVNT